MIKKDYLKHLAMELSGDHLVVVSMDVIVGRVYPTSKETCVVAIEPTFNEDNAKIIEFVNNWMLSPKPSLPPIRLIASDA
jgi:hypothetical protein